MLEKTEVVALNPSGIAILPDRTRSVLRQNVVDQLAESIKAQGQLQPIIVRPRPRGGMGYILVAGWHRLMAIRKLKRDSINAIIADGMINDEALLAEIDENLVRANLTAAEEALHYKKRHELYEKIHGKAKARGARASNKKKGHKTQPQDLALAFTTEVAEKTGLSARTIQAKIARSNVVAMFPDVINTSLDREEELDILARLPEKEQRALVKRAKKGEKVSAKLRMKQIKREERERELGAKQAALPDKKYGVILADPEWRFEPWSRETGMSRAPDNHYPTNILEVIKSRPVESIAAKDCVLFLWATIPMLPHALLVMAAWGFDYKSNYVWAKDKAGTGYWNREQHETLLVGSRGNVPCPAPGKQKKSLIEAPRGKRHSEKPEIVLEMIEKYFPSLPKIELNRRGPPRDGWDAWGNEVVQEAAE